MQGSNARRPARRHARELRIGLGLAPLVPLLLVLLPSVACGPSATELRGRDPRPNVLVISLDTTRADHLSAYGYERKTSPRLETLAREGVRFDAAYAPSATTGPTHASLFTGLAPMTHDVRKNGHRLADALPTLAEQLSTAGFETAGVVSSFVLSARFGFSQGFDVWDEDFSNATAPEGVTIWEGFEVEGKFYGSAEDTTRRALDWLDGRSHPERPFFLLVHYFDPHDPYTPPPGYRPPFDPGPKVALKQVRTVFLYDLLLAFTDEQMGALLDGLDERGLAADTLVVVVGDHGEGLMDHGHPYHGAQIYEEAVRVPLVARWPGRIEPGHVVERPAALVDLAPALLEIVGEGSGGLETQDRTSGLRLVGEASAEPPEGTSTDEPVFLYRRHYEPARLTDEIEVAGEQYGVRLGRWKLIEGPDEGRLELYDLEADAGERSNVAADHPERVAELAALLEGWRRASAGAREQWRAAAGEPATGHELDAAERARLEALGYVE